MKSRFNEFLKVHSPVSEDVPLTHATDAFTFRDVMESDTLRATECTMFNGEKLLYFFVGRAAYRANAGVEPNALQSYAPVCFILSSVVAADLKRVFPFDTGGFQARLYDPAMHHRMSKEDFELDATYDSARRVIKVFFGNVRGYMENSVLEDVPIPPTSYEAESFFSLITDKMRNTYDDRVSAIECQVDHDVNLTGCVDAVVLPSRLAEEMSVLSKLREWGAMPIPYQIVGRLKPSEYMSKVADLVRDYLTS